MADFSELYYSTHKLVILLMSMGCIMSVLDLLTMLLLHVNHQLPILT